MFVLLWTNFRFWLYAMFLPTSVRIVITLFCFVVVVGSVLYGIRLSIYLYHSGLLHWHLSNCEASEVTLKCMGNMNRYQSTWKHMVRTMGIILAIPCITYRYSSRVWYHIDFTWALWHHKSPATAQFVLQLAQANKYMSKLHNTVVRSGRFPSQRANNVESVSVSWRHHEHVHISCDVVKLIFNDQGSFWVRAQLMRDYVTTQGLSLAEPISRMIPEWSSHTPLLLGISCAHNVLMTLTKALISNTSSGWPNEEYLFESSWHRKCCMYTF